MKASRNGPVFLEERVSAITDKGAHDDIVGLFKHFGDLPCPELFEVFGRKHKPELVLQN